ncbi:hypothetical protein H6P81_014580 [Aristolochia fimbriata]|uniref:Uncharacterized protein n=1 Tax=Aristolochia fimbriata TaxID=158543 RepID=A0AAV7E2V8_ARIFI|nr:hypothetical protein H6P81_014580 [Aristolochia fimbriata]
MRLQEADRSASITKNSVKILARRAASGTMLQWMGGSRRKVTTARRSTHNRQKQYFEQKKQRYLASGLVCHDDEKHKQTQYYGNCASLDIASLENLAKLTQECRYNDTTNEHISTCNRVEIASQKKFDGSIFPDNERSAETKSSIINNDKVDKKDVPTDVQLLVFDFLGDYEFHDSSLGRSTHEAHVAFSVEGLGKIKTETPVRSPIQFRSPPNIQLTSRMTKSVPHGSPSRCMPNSGDSFVDFLDKCKFCCTGEERDDAFGGNSFGDKAWDGPSSFLDDNAFDDKTYGVTWKSQKFSVDNDFHRDNTQENFDYDFEHTFLFNKRHLGEMHNNPNRMSDLWQMDSPVSSLNHLPSENKNDFKSFIMGRCPGDFGSSNTELFSDPSWSSFHSEDSRKSMSLLSCSEESCSSSTEAPRTNTPCTLYCQDIEEMSGIQPTGSNVSGGMKKDDMPEVDADLSSRGATNEGTTWISSGTTGSAKNVERTNVLSEDAKDEEITNAKVSDKAKEKNAEVIDNPGKSLESAQDILTKFMEIPPKLEIFTGDTEHHKDAGIRLNTKISTRDAERKTSEPELKLCGKEQLHVEQSYEMMLESYVLQLLCVRKVLEASEDNPVIKF